MNRKKVVNGVTVLAVVSAISVVTACANSTRPRGGNQGPPPEAIEACEGKAEGDSVSFAGRGGESLTATCKMVEDQLVAVPEGHRKR